MEIFKVARNDFCPCGSGRKYKKCCLSRVEEVNYFLNKMVGPDVTALGRQILNTLAFILGLKIEEEAAPPDLERVGRLLMEAWGDEEEKEEIEIDEIEECTEKLVQLLHEKKYLSDIRLPLDSVYWMEEMASKGQDVDELIGQIAQELSENWRFTADAAYAIAYSLRNDSYTDVELKTLLSGIEYLVDDDFRQVFIATVAVATMMEIEKGKERIKAIFEGEEEHDVETEVDFLNFAREHPFYGEYIYEKMLREARPYLSALKKSMKLVPPFYAVIQLCYTFLAKIFEGLARVEDVESIEDVVLGFPWAGQCLWEGREAEYFLPALLQLLVEQIETIDDEELATSAEALFMAVKLSLFLGETDLLEILYVACLHGFFSSMPLTLEGLDVTISKVGDILDERLMARYSQGLKKNGKEKEGDYVWEQFLLRHEEVKRQCMEDKDILYKLREWFQ